jgi:hypothetical protein
LVHLTSALALTALACDPRVQVVTEGSGPPRFAGSQYAARVLATPGVRAYFRFSETGGTVVADRVAGRRLDVDSGVRLGETTTPFDDPELSSLGFFGGQPDHVSGAYDEALHFKRAMTVELWARPRGRDAEGACPQNPEGWTKLVWVDGLEPGFYGAWGLHLHEQDWTALAFHFQVDPQGDGAELQEAAAVTLSGSFEAGDDGGCMDGLWHHIVATYDADGAPNARIYVNGELSPENGEEHPLIGPTTAPGGGIGGYAPEGKLHVGGIGLESGSGDAALGQGLTFDGWLDELALYDRALSPEEIAEHYETGLIPASP